MLRFHGSYQLDQMDNREVIMSLLLVAKSFYVFFLEIILILPIKYHLFYSVLDIYSFSLY